MVDEVYGLLSDISILEESSCVSALSNSPKLCDFPDIPLARLLKISSMLALLRFPKAIVWILGGCTWFRLVRQFSAVQGSDVKGSFQVKA